MVATRNQALGIRAARLLRSAAVCFLGSLFLAACAEGIPPEDTATPSPPPTTATPAPTVAPTPTPLPFTPATSLAGARAFLAAGLFPEALASFEFVAFDTDDAELQAEARTGAAVALHEMGLDDESIEALRLAIETAPGGSGTAERATYLLGVRFAEQEDFGASAATLRDLVATPSGSVLQHYVDTRYASSAALAGDIDDAEGVWDLLLADGTLPRTLRERVYADQAALAVAVGDVQGAIAWLTESAGLTGDPGTRYRLALLAKDAGDSATFATNLRAIVRDSPSSSFALLAVAELELAGERVDPGLVGLVYYRHRDYASARETLELAVADPDASTADLAFRTYYLAAANEDDGLLAPAVVLYDRAATYDPSSQFIHRAYYWAARVSEDLGHYGEASERFHDLVASGPSGPFTTESRFRAGYALYLDSQFAQAVTEWETAPGPSDARTLYWRARALQASGQTIEANTAFEQARALGPRNFYGMQAELALTGGSVVDVSFSAPVEVTPVQWDSVAAWLDQRVPGDFVDVGATAAVELAAIGLPDAARALLSGISDSTDDPWVLLTVAREADRAALNDVVIRITFRVLAETSVSVDDVPMEVGRLLYPLSYVETLNTQGETFGVSPLFLAALIRQESLWSADAVSSANAMGLTQVIEPTGYAIAASLGLADFVPADLFRPSVSIQFGASYIGSQLDRFGDPHHALAAYNGGPGNSAVWAESASFPPADFVAAIEFGETKRYVELVMEHYAWYQFLYGTP